MRGKGAKRQIFATTIMAAFLFIFNYFVDINIFSGVLEILLTIVIYFGVLYMLKGINKEDWKLAKIFLRR